MQNLLTRNTTLQERLKQANIDDSGAKRLGGNVTVTSELGVGSVFTVLLPKQEIQDK